MGIVTWIVLGLVAGAVAKLVLAKTPPSGWLVPLVLGVLGATLGGFVGVVVGFGGINDLKIGAVLLAVLGATLVLSGCRAVTKRGGL